MRTVRDCAQCFYICSFLIEITSDLHLTVLGVLHLQQDDCHGVGNLQNTGSEDILDDNNAHLANDRIKT